MGRFVGWVVVVAAVLVLTGGQLWDGIGGTVGKIWTAVSPAPNCDLLLADGTFVRVAPEVAADWTTAQLSATPANVSPPPQPLALQQPAAVTCSVPQPQGPAQAAGASGLTPRAETLHSAALQQFGAVPYGGFAPQGVTTGHGARSAHYEGRAVDYFFRPVGDAEQRARGWEMANWLVANSSDLEVAVIIFDDRIWSTRRSSQGWRPYSNPDGGSDPISRHLDHIHVDVIRGG